MTEKERFGLVFTKTGSKNSGTGYTKFAGWKTGPAHELSVQNGQCKKTEDGHKMDMNPSISRKM